MRKVFWLGVGVSLVWVGRVAADGMIIPRPFKQVSETAQKAVLWYDGKKETMVVSTTFKGDSEEFVWLVPVPSLPEVRAGKDELLVALDEYTRPPAREEYPMPVPMMMGGSFGVDKVVVYQTKKVDIYDVAVVGAVGSDELSQWLTKNGYEYPKNREYLLKSYIDRGWYFVAAKVNPGALGYAGGMLREGHATPLVITFATGRIVYPLKISGPGEVEKKLTLAEKETDWQERGGKWYKRVWVNTATWQEAETVCSQMGATLASVANKEEDRFLTQMCGVGNICYLGHRNPGGYCSKNYQPWVDGTKFSYQNWDPGEPEFECREDCLNISHKGAWNNEWCDNHWQYQKYALCQVKEVGKPGVLAASSGMWQALQRRPTPGPPREEQASLVLYVLADHKQTVPGWNVEYAGWVGKKTVENWAVDESGEPWMAVPGRRFLTKLTRRMRPVEMVDDVVLRPAEKDTPEGGGRGEPVWGEGRSWLVWGLPVVAELVIIGYIVYRRQKV